MMSSMLSSTPIVSTWIDVTFEMRTFPSSQALIEKPKPEIGGEH